MINGYEKQREILKRKARSCVIASTVLFGVGTLVIIALTLIRYN